MQQIDNTAMDTDDEINTRLQRLELLVGLNSKEGIEYSLPDNLKSHEQDVLSRLETLEQKWKTCTTPLFQPLSEEMDSLLEELHPGGAALTYQQVLSGRSKDYPLLYRKQIVLASWDSLRRDMAELSNILNLLYISQSSPRDKDWTQAPILHISPIPPEDDARLEALCASAAQCQHQTILLANRVDLLLSTYQTAMKNLSERIIRLDERINEASVITE
jgi:hypothetical protein